MYHLFTFFIFYIWQIRRSHTAPKRQRPIERLADEASSGFKKWKVDMMLGGKEGKKMFLGAIKMITVHLIKKLCCRPTE